MATYQVPVWFNVEAESSYEAWDRVLSALARERSGILTKEPQITEWTVEEPTYIEEN